MSEGFILHGTIVYSRDPEHLEECPDSYVICRDGYSQGVYSTIPEEFRDLPVEDYWDKLIIPGMMDLFASAPAWQARGMSLNLENQNLRRSLMDKIEISLEDETVAERSYDMFVDSLYIGATTRAVVLGDSRVESTLKLMDLMDESGLISCVGLKPSRNLDLQKGADAGMETLAVWLNACADRFERTSPILFLADSEQLSDAELSDLVTVVKETGLPTFRGAEHLRTDEGNTRRLRNRTEEAAEDERLFKSGLLGTYGNSILYGCPDLAAVKNYLNDTETYAVSCPVTEGFCRNLPGFGSSAGQLHFCLDNDMKAGIGSGLGECGADMMKTLRGTLFASKLQTSRTGQSAGNDLKGVNKTLPGIRTFEEAFYIATAGSGRFFGNCGSFEKGCQFDAVILDDQICDTMVALTPGERLERMMYLSDDRNVVGKYVFGDKLY